MSLPSRLAFIDVESTGAHPVRDRITEIAILRIEDGEVVARWESLVAPGQSIPPLIEQVTGISDAMVADAPPFAAVADTVAALDELRLGGVRFDVATRTGYYSGMVVEKATIKRTAKNGKGGDISISLRRIRVVSSQTVASPKPKEPRGQLKTSKGEQHPVPASGPKTSGLALITDALPDWMKF